MGDEAGTGRASDAPSNEIVSESLPLAGEPVREPPASGHYARSRPSDGEGDSLQGASGLTSERRYRSYFELAPIGMAVLSVDGRWIDVNPRLCTMLGFSESEIRSRGWTELVHPSERERSRAALRRLISENRLASCDRLYVRKDGSALCVNETLRTVGPAEGMADGIVLLIQDITETKKLQEQLRQSKKMEAVGLLASGIAHDFNNILQVIISSTELAMKETIEGGGHARLEQVVSAAECASVFARQLLTIGRGEQAERKPSDLNQEIELSENFLSGLVFPNQLEVQLAESLPLIESDRDQLRQVFINLALNARDAMPESGMVTIRTEAVWLDERFCRQHLNTSPGRYVVLEIEDTGTGMEEDTMERMFEPFFTTKPAERGSGLGLALVYGIVKSHQGHIAARSGPDEGTRFRIYFPAIDPSVH